MSEVNTRRLLSELGDLIEKYDKLNLFMDSKEFSKLDEYVRGLMIEQHQAMLNYKWALRNRIEYIEEQQLQKADD